MNEERIEAYLALIESLMTCTSGEELEILNANLDLIDAGLVETMQMVSAKLEQEGNHDAAEFLQEFATQLNAAMGNAAAAAASPEEYFNFLGEILQVVSENPDPQVVYPLLQNNVDKLDGFFAQLLQSWAMSTLPQVDQEEGEGLAGVIGNFSNLIQQFPMGDKGSNLEIAITGYEIAAAVFSPESFPEVWAGTQNNLAVAYSDRPQGDRLENLEQAISCYENALQVYTLDKFPEQWAMAQRNLAIAEDERKVLAGVV
ncbi:MAG: tetratricopeptide repeat protein [Microcoleus vaginatus WJT46-NPBG5]|jgi:tetratricopeptide (TPR) repeat protein|nr:tetratricopeptide repeat protein [Microcoleus vaginatus WJT46-NPBG5]